MRFMLFMHPRLDPETNWTPTPEAVATMERYNEELRQAGVLLDLAGLHDAAEGSYVRFPGGKPVVEDGPYGEAKEVVGGYWLIEVGSPQEAVQWATRCPGGGDCAIEVRRVAMMEDFPEDVQAASREVQAASHEVRDPS